MYLNNISVHAFIAFTSPFPFHDVTRPRSAAAPISNAPARGRRGHSCGRKETGHLLFPYSDMKRHFYFCRPPRTAAISTVFKIPSRKYQCHVRERDSRVRGSRRLTIWISLIPSKHLFPPSRPRNPSFFHNFPYSSPNRPARDSASYTQSGSKLPLPICFCEFLCTAIRFLFVCHPLFLHFYLRRGECSRDVLRATFNFKRIYYFTTNE